MKTRVVGAVVTLLLLIIDNGFVNCERPAVVNVGAIFTFDSVIGRVAKVAMEAAVADVNANRTILNGIKLELVMEDVNCSAFMGSIRAFQMLEKEVVAIIGPQSSTIAHMVSFITSNLEVPLISYAATDPTLSALQFPFFLRTTQSDSHQMAAVAALIDFYGWRSVISIFVDDEYGRNGISALEDELKKNMATISFKLPLPIQFGVDDITRLLNKSKSFGPRIYVVHVNPDPSFKIFSVVQKLKMMTSDYVWIATDWLCATLYSSSPLNQSSLGILQGVVGFCQHTPQSVGKKDFVSRWESMQQEGSKFGLNSYGLNAYDTIWAVAYSIDKLLRDNSNFTLSFSDKFITKGTKIQFERLKVFNGGALLTRELLDTNFTGLSGQVHIKSGRDLVSGGYEVININQRMIRTIGYWSNHLGLSVSPSETVNSHIDEKLENIVWPGGNRDRPRGWVVAENEKPLRIAVPKRASFVEFVRELNDGHKIEGYCIDVFNEARKLVPYDIPYKFEAFGDGRSNPNYDELVKLVGDRVMDAVVGDIAIVTNRTKIVDFTQPYIAAGLVIVAPISNTKSSGWVFLKPFTVELWCMIAASFVVIAVVIWILEHRVNKDFRGPPKRQFKTMFLFSFSTLFKTNQEDIMSTLGRIVMVVWLFLLMVITSSYTASLTSILTVQQLSSPITGIDSLITSDWPIGYQVGSFAYGYLANNLYIPRSRLVSLGSPEEYAQALQQGPANGGVGAIVDELPYVELFLSKHTQFGIAAQTFTKGGWGFAFPRDSPLAIDMSTAILKLSESGKLQRIHEKWFCKLGCPGELRRSSEPNQLHFESFRGLYLSCGIFILAAFLLFLIRAVQQFIRYKKKQMDSSPQLQLSSTTNCRQVFFHFFDFVDEKEEAIKMFFKQCENPQSQVRHDRTNDVNTVLGKI